MATNNLARLYQERLQHANNRIFELKMIVEQHNDEIAAIRHNTIAQDSEDELRTQLSEIKSEAPAQMKRKNRELAKLQEQVRDKDSQMLQLQQQLDLEKATITRARKAIEGRSPSPIASSSNALVGNEGGGNRSRLKREREETPYTSDIETDDDPIVVEPKPKRAAIEPINLDDDEDDGEVATDHRDSSTLDHPLDVPEFDYKICMEPLRATKTEMCNREQLPQSLLDAANAFGGQWHANYSGQVKNNIWQTKMRPCCLRMKLWKLGTVWRAGDEGSVACNGCVQRGLPRFKWIGKGIFMLPLHEDDRTKVVADGEIVEGRWITSAD